jgi:possible endonuclease-methyltransferase fusion protein
LPNSDLELFNGLDKPVVVGSKILMLVTESIDEAYYISAILNLQSIIDIIDAYAVNFK